MNTEKRKNTPQDSQKNGETEQFSHTIFDDVFRTIVEHFPQLFIALINEVFGLSYPEYATVQQYRNEHMEPGGKVITDSVLSIEGTFFHIECQSSFDNRMVIRMVAYDIAVALDHPVEDPSRRCRIRLPQSCVMYVKDSDKVPDELVMDVEFSDGRVYPYHVKTVECRDTRRKRFLRSICSSFSPTTFSGTGIRSGRWKRTRN